MLWKWSQNLNDSYKCSSKPSFTSIKFYKWIGFLTLETPYWLVHIIWIPNKNYVFLYFFQCCIYFWGYLYLEFQCTCVLDTCFKLKNWNFVEITYVIVVDIKMVMLVPDVPHQTFKFY
jgi:hypothetical protein